MRSKLAKLLRRWADRLEPPVEWHEAGVMFAATDDGRILRFDSKDGEITDMTEVKEGK